MSLQDELAKVEQIADVEERTKRREYLEELDAKKKDRDKEIAKEIRRIKGIFKEISDPKKKSLQALIEEAAFMKVTLKDLKETINFEGPIDEMPQGDYSILRQHPAVQIYNSMMQRYTTVHKELIAVLPKEELEEDEDDGFNTFVSDKS